MSTIGDSGIEPHQLLDLRIVHVGKQALGAQRGIVDEAVERADARLQFAHHLGDGLELR